jgi:hypothetical protein
LPGTNTVAYLALSSATKETSFITLAPGINIKTFFASLLTTIPKKLEHLSLASVSSWSQTFAVKTSSLSKRTPNRKALQDRIITSLSNLITQAEIETFNKILERYSKQKCF